MANVETVSGLALASIEKISGLSSSDIEKLSGLETVSAPASVNWLVVAGGGPGGAGNQRSNTTNDRGGGGGAGGLRTSFGSNSGGGASAESALSVTVGTQYTVTIGAGGAMSSLFASEGDDSSISGSGMTTITCAGGGT